MLLLSKHGGGKLHKGTQKWCEVAKSDKKLIYIYHHPPPTKYNTICRQKFVQTWYKYAPQFYLPLPAITVFLPFLKKIFLCLCVLHFYTMILQRIRIIVGEAIFEPGIPAPEVCYNCATMGPAPHFFGHAHMALCHPGLWVMMRGPSTSFA